jgi:methylenetetrahydrofolate dehydrogenase (NADP+)/methenyltetrahydrofolate cyclohydrolase/formyltetrahydrofolate synthetase
VLQPFIPTLPTNHFYRSDSDAELALIREESLTAGADAAVVSNHWAKGGAGARDLAEAVINICEGDSQFKFLYDLDLPIEEKIAIIGKEIYGADGIKLSDLARQQVDNYSRQGYGGLPSESVSQIHILFADIAVVVCMAKTQYSFSHDPKLKNVPSGMEHDSIFFRDSV